MNPELQQTLAALANKLGTSIERLWPMLVKREFAEHLAWFLFCLTLLAASSLSLALALRSLLRCRDILAKPFSVRSLTEDHALGWKREWAVASAITALTSLAGLCAAIPGLVAPEASAIYKLLGR